MVRPVLLFLCYLLVQPALQFPLVLVLQPDQKALHYQWLQLVLWDQSVLVDLADHLVPCLLLDPEDLSAQDPLLDPGILVVLKDLVNLEGQRVLQVLLLLLVQ